MSLSKQVVNRYWQDLDLTKLKFVHFNGGEPLLSKEHVEFLQSIPNKQIVQLNYNTNATVRPSEDLIKLWEEFDLIMLDFSIDDIGTRYEYQRYPASWAEVTENLQWFKQSMPTNTMFSINTTISVLNQDLISELDSWVAENFYENRLGDAVSHRKQLANGILSVDSPLSDCVKYLDQCDKRRGTDWREVFPILSQNIINIR
jgi:MoaA/NifB/PqqE/SkfB family radical SAM enzyme